ncbi:MAG: hypothetical protein J7K77_01260 [Dehalococcoidales bacterium]|nr:hypothetical protein [Dehalococcoidales bacterium]
MEQHKAYRYATEVITTNSLTADDYEGQVAFLEKRKLVWREHWGKGARGDIFVLEEGH